MMWNDIKIFGNMMGDIYQFMCKRWLSALCVIGLIVVAIYCSTEIYAAGKTVSAKAPAVVDNKEVGHPIVPDSLYMLYCGLATRMDDAEKIVKNYQGDANVVIVKANHMVSLWLVVSSSLVALVIGMSIWNNYKQEKLAEKVRKDLECTAQINKIGSIMTCLNSLPDPLLTDTEAGRKRYVKTNIEMLYREFSAYIKLVNTNSDVSGSDLNYVQLVLSVMKIVILRVQSVFSDKISSVAFYSLSGALDKSIKDIQNGTITHKELKSSLKDIFSQFDKLKAAI